MSMFSTEQMEMEPFDIPVIDFGRFLNPASLQDKLLVANSIVAAFKAVGFIYLDKHGIPKTDVRGLFAQVSLVLHFHRLR